MNHIFKINTNKIKPSSFKSSEHINEEVDGMGQLHLGWANYTWDGLQPDVTTNGDRFYVVRQLSKL